MSKCRHPSCLICHSRSLKWFCQCSDLPLCRKSSCVSTHLSNPSQFHTLVDYESGMTTRRDHDPSLSEWIRIEEKWLREEKQQSVVAIDRQVKVYCQDIKDLAERKKRDLDDIVAQSIAEYQPSDKPGQLQEPARPWKHMSRLTCAFGELPITDLIMITVASRDEHIYYISKTAEGNWTCTAPVDAICIRTSKDILLTGLALTKSYSFPPLSLETLQILTGSNTAGPVIYSHNDRVCMQSDHPFSKVVKLKKEVRITANTEFTIRTVVKGGDGSPIQVLIGGEQDGLSITITKPTFAGGDVDNSSDQSTGSFFELHYRLLDS